jgi:hypothetical protein
MSRDTFTFLTVAQLNYTKHNMKKITIPALTLVFFLISGCSLVKTDYKSFEGSQSGIVQGKGGSKVIIDEMDIWDDGEPPRKFKLIGFIDDTRETGLLQISSRKNIVKKAHEVGGDAVIKLHTQSQLESLYSAGGASAYAYGVHVHTSSYESSDKLISKYAVITYLENPKQQVALTPSTEIVTDAKQNETKKGFFEQWFGK